MEDKRTYKDTVLIILVLINAVIVGILLSSPTLKLIQAIATPITLLYIAKSVTKKLAEQERQTREQRDKQEALKDYLTQMTTLLVDKQLAQQPHDSPIAQAAKALTISLLLELDINRTRQLTRFLYDAKLIQNNSQLQSNVEENKAQPTLLKSSELSGFDLTFAMLANADLSNSKLIRVNLVNATLQGAMLIDADLTHAVLVNADLMTAQLINANLRGAILVNANLCFTVLVNTDLMCADLQGAILSSTVFKDAKLFGANLSNTMIKSADLKDAQYTKDHRDIPDTIFPEDFNPETAGMKQLSNEWRYDWNSNTWWTTSVKKEDIEKE